MHLVPWKMLPNVICVHYTHRLAKMLILQNNEAKGAVNSILRDLGLGEVDLDSNNFNRYVYVCYAILYKCTYTPVCIRKLYSGEAFKESALS